MEKKFALVLRVMKKLTVKRQISIDDVTPAMIHEARPTFTESNIKAVLDFVKGYISLNRLVEEVVQKKVQKNGK